MEIPKSNNLVKILSPNKKHTNLRKLSIMNTVCKNASSPSKSNQCSVEIPHDEAPTNIYGIHDN